MAIGRFYRFYVFCLIISLSAIFIDAYEAVYLCVIGLLLGYILIEKEITGRIFGLYLIAYLSIALLNISTYRNYISIETIRIYFVCLIALLIPMVVYRPKKVAFSPEYIPSAWTNAMLLGHLAIAWGCLLFVYAQYGPVVLDQDLRFLIPTGLGYTIRSVQFLPVYMLVCRNRKKFPIPISLATVLAIAPTLLIASRATAALVLAAMAIFVVAMRSYGWEGGGRVGEVRLGSLGTPFWRRRRVRVSILVFAGLAGMMIVIGGFYLRRSSGSDLLTGVELVSRYFDPNNPFSYLIAPVHQGFNETAALTSRIVDFHIRNVFTSTPLLWADFDNLLGRSHIAAAQYFGDAIGRAEAGGLTPGLVGGTLLDFPNTYFLWFFGLGVLVSISRAAGTKSRLYLCFHAIFLSQVFHLIHRGFIKPEYISIMLIAAIYLFTMKKTKNGIPAGRVVR